MKEIKAVIRPNRLAPLRDAIRQIPGFPGMTISKAEGCAGRASGAGQASLKEDLTDYIPKVRIEMIVPDEHAEALADCIVQVAQSGPGGDSLVWISDVERAVFSNKRQVS